MNEEYITNSFEETQSLGESFAKKLKGGDFVAFYGNLGSGKTTFIQGLAKGLGIKRRITSPTFIILRHYKMEKGFFYHIDLYRIETLKDLLGLGINEVLEDRTNIIAVEWAEKMGKLLPKKRLDINFEYIDENKREIKITEHV